MSWYIGCLKKYGVFKGRARRKEYWYFVLFNLIFVIAAMILDRLFGTFDSNSGYGVIYGLYVLAVFVPGLAVSVRRLHDLGKSGWWLLIALIPLVGGIWLIVLYATEGQHIDNQYGPDPKAIIPPIPQPV